MTPAQYGHLMENLAEDAWTAGSDGRLVTYLPVLDSHAVDRAVTARHGGAPLFIQVKAHRRERPGDRLAFAVPLSEVGAYEGWYCLFLEGDERGIRKSYLVPGADLLERGERGTLIDGRPCVRLTLSPTSPTWSAFFVTDLAQALERLLPAAPPATLAPPEPTRSQEQGAFFEESVVATILDATTQLALYRPAVDVGRDLLVQRAGTRAAVYLQVKGTDREDRPGLARFQVRRRSLAAGPDLLFLFCFARDAAINPAWLVPAPEFVGGASTADPDHLSFEAHIDGDDPRWGRYRLRLASVPDRLLATMGGP